MPMKFIDYLNEDVKVPRITHLGYFLFFWISLGLTAVKIIDRL